MPWSIPFSVINAKGGVGKTTTAVNVAAMAVTLGKSDGSPLKALIIDIDHQTNATQQLGYHDLDRVMTLAGHVTRDAELNRIIIHNACAIEGLDLIPSHFQLAYVDKGVLARGTWMRRMLREIIPQYDLIIFDCPADLGDFTTNALASSEGILIPTQAEKHSVTGLPHLIACARQIFEETECSKPWAYVLITMFSQNNGIERSWKQEVEQKYQDSVLRTHVRRNTDVEKAVTSGMPMSVFDKHCHGYEDYCSATRELLTIFEELRRPQLKVVSPSFSAAS